MANRNSNQPQSTSSFIMAVMRAVTFFMLRFLLVLISLLFVKRPMFLQPDGVSITLNVAEEFYGVKEAYIYSSLLVNMPRRLNTTRSCFGTILLLMCGDIESCPGPGYQDLPTFTNTKGMKVLHQNIRGLHQNLSNLAQIFESGNIDIFTLSETHVVQDSYMDVDDLYTIPGYTFVKRNRATGKGGGVAIYISNKLMFNRREDLEHEDIESIWVEIVLKKAKNLLIGTMYRPPDSSLYHDKNFDTKFESILGKINDTKLETILLGDLNMNYLVKSDHKSSKEIADEYHFEQVIKTPTRITKDSSTLIDVILTNKPAAISRYGVIPLSLSDHDCVGCVRKLNHERFNPRTITCRDYRKYNPQDLCNDLNNKDWSSVYDSTCPNSAWTKMKEILTNTFTSHVPSITKRVKGRYCPWLTEEIKQHLNERDKLLRKARKSKSHIEWKKYKRKKNYCNNFVRQAKNTYQQNLLTENLKDSNKFWDMIKRVFPIKGGKSQKSSAPYIDDSDNSAKSKANAFCNFFSNVACNLKNHTYPVIDFVWKKVSRFPLRTTNVFKFHYVSRVFVEKELKRLKTKKSVGLDDLPPRLLKDTAKVISGPLSHIINLSLKLGIVPSEFKDAKLIPLHKNGKVTSANNYRPISILSVVSKIMERAVHTQLVEYLENNKLLSPQQFGFRKERSTELASTLLLNNIRKEVDSGKLVGAVFIDLSKAFDTLGHAVLLSKLESYGVLHTELEWFTSYLFNRKQVCLYDGEVSDVQPVTCGVPQGSILGPLMFLIHFNDFPDVVKHSKVVQFADDTVIYISDNCFYTIERKLNEDLSYIADYFHLNELIINLNKGKTECVLFGTSRKLSKFPNGLNVFYQSNKVVNSSRYKYLGSRINQTLNMSENFSYLYKQASNKLHMLSAISEGLPATCINRIYRVMILPALMYNCVTSLNMKAGQTRKLESIQNRAEKLSDKPQENIVRMMEKKAVVLVKKSLEGLLCDNFTGYFQLNCHGKATRNGNSFLKIPKVKLEYARSGFFSMGVKHFNALPIEMRQIESFGDFKKSCDTHFSALKS